MSAYKCKLKVMIILSNHEKKNHQFGLCNEEHLECNLNDKMDIEKFKTMCVACENMSVKRKTQ